MPQITVRTMARVYVPVDVTVEVDDETVAAVLAGDEQAENTIVSARLATIADVSGEDVRCALDADDELEYLDQAVAEAIRSKSRGA